MSMQKKKKWSYWKKLCARETFQHGIFLHAHVLQHSCACSRTVFFVRETLCQHGNFFECSHEKFLVHTWKSFLRAHKKFLSQETFHVLMRNFSAWDFFFVSRVTTFACTLKPLYFFFFLQRSSVFCSDSQKKKKVFDYVHRKTQVVPYICTMVGGQE